MANCKALTGSAVKGLKRSLAYIAYDTTDEISGMRRHTFAAQLAFTDLQSRSSVLTTIVGM